MGCSWEPGKMTDILSHDKSDIRIHVCPFVKRLYTFKTEDVRKSILAGLGQKTSATQEFAGEITSWAYLVEPKDIHEKIYQIAISSGKTTIQLNPIGGGSEIFQEKRRIKYD